MNNLFEKRKTIEQERRRPTRPLGPLSDFVVQGMPSVLTDIREGKRAVAEMVEFPEALLKGRESQILGRLSSDVARDIAGLDVKMLEAGIVNSGGLPGPRLSGLVDRLSDMTRLQKGVTYEDLVFINPLQSDPRLFTSGHVGKSERDFYLGHRLLEDALTATLAKSLEAQSVLVARGSSGISKAASFLKETPKLFSPVTHYTQTIGMNMSPEDFAVFRKYLTGNTVRGILGPSGKYTAGIPTLDFLLAGRAMEAEYPNLDKELSYYPRDGQKDIQRARALARKGESITDLIHTFGNPAELIEATKELSAAIRQFRGMHYKSVGRQVPEAIADTVAGTGGEQSPGAFLRRRQRIRHLGSKENL